MKVLIIGNGGREHALAWKVAQSNLVEQVFVAPGNGGTAIEPLVQNISISATDIAELLRFAQDNVIGLTIVGPEVPLSMGIVDQFNEAGIACFGPNKKAAQLESSKAFAKAFMQRHKIATANYATFTSLPDALNYLEQQHYPLVIKADGLAAGKGVVIVEDYQQANKVAKDILLDTIFGDAGSQIIVESFLSGEEVSYICMVDGQHVLPLASSQDHKAAYDGDTGPNTGGMGAYSPAPLVDAAMDKKILDTVIYPTVNGLLADGIHFTGFLYAGLMIDENEIPQVLEYNCRLGDPETQPILMRLKSDIVAHCIAALNNELDSQQAQWDSRPALGVVMASEGYPGEANDNKVIAGLENNTIADMKIFHAGTRREEDLLYTNGGRILCVTALGETITSAQVNAYQSVKNITWEGGWCRSDIGYKAIVGR